MNADKPTRLEIQQAIRNSIAHWNRMIEWVKQQPGTNRVSHDEMIERIGENWNGEYCPLCALFYNPQSCDHCPLLRKTCYESNSLWEKINQSQTWSEWLLNAPAVLAELEECLADTRNPTIPPQKETLAI